MKLWVSALQNRHAAALVSQWAVPSQAAKVSLMGAFEPIVETLLLPFPGIRA